MLYYTMLHTICYIIQYSQFLKVHVYFFFPDPGDLNFQRDRFPRTNLGFPMNYYAILYLEIWDLRPSI